MFRKIVFWTHLVVGLTIGVLVAIMSFTGAALAFEKEIIAWAERDAREIAAPAADAPRLTLDEVLQRARAAKPDLRVANITLATNPRAAIALGLPNNTTVYVNPYTGELREAQAPRTRAFMQFMRGWHTRLNFRPTPGKPTLGAQLNAAANTAFVFLCISGLVLWWPRTWTARALRPALWFVGSARGKSRDWNWHNVIGFWTLPALFIMAASGVVLSYRWAGDLVFRVVGEAPPSPGRPAPPPGGATRPTPELAAAKTSVAGNQTVSPAEFAKQITREFPRWEQITLRFNPPLRTDTPPTAPTAVVRSAGQWPPFSSTNVTLDTTTGTLRSNDAYTTLSTGTRARRWIRLLHTGEALRWPGELVAGVGCLGACVLVWTGIALAWRRFFGRADPTAAGPA